MREECLCDWQEGCGGTGRVECNGCGGDLCTCPCGGEAECPGCDECPLDKVLQDSEAAAHG